MAEEPKEPQPQGPAISEASERARDFLFESLIKTQEPPGDQGGISEEREATAYLEAFSASEAQRLRQREALTPALRNIAQIWVIAVLMLLVWQGFGSKIGFFYLSDTVLVTLISTTTANILGLFYIAVRYLYANPDYKSPRSRKPNGE